MIKIFKKEDGGVIFTKAITNKIAGSITDLNFIELDESEIPSHDLHESLYFDGTCSKDNLKVDHTWDIQLMPEFLIKEKHLKRIDAKLDEELAKQTPNAIEGLKFQRKKEKAKEFKTKDWFVQALANLDDRVANGEPDKPIIRQKLQEKINES